MVCFVRSASSLSPVSRRSMFVSRPVHSSVTGNWTIYIARKVTVLHEGKTLAEGSMEAVQRVRDQVPGVV